MATYALDKVRQLWQQEELTPNRCWANVRLSSRRSLLQHLEAQQQEIQTLQKAVRTLQQAVKG